MIDELPVLDELERRLTGGCYGPPERKRVRWRWAFAGALATAGAAIVLLLAIGSGSGAPSAALALADAAAAVQRGPAQPPMRPGQYWYTRTILSIRGLVLPIVPNEIPAGQSPGPPALVRLDVRQSIETWIGLDGTLRTRLTQLSFRFASPADRARWLAAKQRFPAGFRRSDSITIGDGLFPPQLSGGPANPGDGLFSYRQLMSLPSNVAQLRSRIERAQAAFQARLDQGLSQFKGKGYAPMQLRDTLSPTQERASSDLQAIVALLATPVPTSLRAALFRVAATLPGVTYQGPARDPVGRPGIAIAVGTRRSQTRMIFDPHTGQLLANAQGQDAISTVVAQGVVGSINALPPHVAPVPGAARLQPQLIAISPRTGGARTTFTLHLPGSVSNLRHAGPTLPPMIFGPTGPGCHFSLSVPPFARIPPGRVTRRSGRTAYVYRLAPSAIGRRAWCTGRYQLQITPVGPNQALSSIYFQVS